MKRHKESAKIKIVSNYQYNPKDIIGVGTWGTVFKGSLVSPLQQRSQSQSIIINSQTKSIKGSAVLENQSQAKVYAIKRINKFKIQSSESTFEKYRSEVFTLQKALHIDQVIHFVDFFKSQTCYYIVTEYEQGSLDLYAIMEQNKGKFTQMQTRIITRDIFLAVKELHKLEIMHRDLKLQNVLYIKQKKRAKVIDFGLAMCLPDPQTGEINTNKVGSPLFMAPQVIFEMPYTKKCDIWSLGILLYTMVCRVSPYGQNPSIKHIEREMKSIKERGNVLFPDFQYISEDCKEVIRVCLQWEESQRYPIQKILEMDFFHQPVLDGNHPFRQGYYQPQIGFKS